MPDPVLMIKANTAATRSIIPDEASLKNSLNSLFIC